MTTTLLKRERMHNLRRLRITEQLIDFSSNDYLGLARSPFLATRVMRERRLHPSQLNGLGSTGSRLLTGNSLYAQDLEHRIATFHGFEAGLLFNCGYMANMGLLSAIPGTGDTIFFDTGVHASMRDGIRLSGAQAYSFRHNDCNSLETRLKNCSSSGDRFICIESLYSTDGSMAPLSDMCRLAREYDARLIVDEAHAVGTCGPEGRGLVAEQGLTSQVFAQINTFGKALGTYGAIVLGSSALKQLLINFATSFIYTTALPFHSLAAIHCSYDLFPKMEQERKHLHSLIRAFRAARPHSSATPIQSILIRGNQAVKLMAERIAQEGFDVRPLLSPTVQQGHEILRVCLHSFNTEGEVMKLLEHLPTEAQSHREKQDG